MTRAELLSLLSEVRSGARTPEAAQDQLLQYLRQAPFEDLGFARVDHHRALRQGFPEVVLGLARRPPRSPPSPNASSPRPQPARHAHRRRAFDAVRRASPSAKFHELARTITLALGELATGHAARIVVAAAGTSDLPVAEEAAVTAELMGNDVDRLYDVGVAGLHRLLAEHARLDRRPRHHRRRRHGRGAAERGRRAWSSVPVIAVPTSVGYGASFGGLAALLAMLNSCATGVSVVNIDNGFGAAAVASAINHLD